MLRVGREQSLLFSFSSYPSLHRDKFQTPISPKFLHLQTRSPPATASLGGQRHAGDPREVEKKATPADLYRTLRRYIASAYSDRNAATTDDDLCAVRDLRAAAVEPPALPDLSSLDQRRAALLAYARARPRRGPLPRLPRPRAPPLPLLHDVFKTSKKASLPSLHLERAAVLFNLAAVHSQIALAADRVTDVGIRTACGAFQSAVGAFAAGSPPRARAAAADAANAANGAPAGGEGRRLGPDCVFILFLGWCL
ncbi:hypothetical protein QYE76_044009 [Lolium multiflorum]|uniref:BRO1 domain-containing protein n=1 Tax=Lolium multiflorum TaxID=4521 RepID=A0AAD8WYF7_LOLMU|nr:hypothetical protein QYE76_044009 [Lolium multiflorum]